MDETNDSDRIWPYLLAGCVRAFSWRACSQGVSTRVRRPARFSAASGSRCPVARWGSHSVVEGSPGCIVGRGRAKRQDGAREWATPGVERTRARCWGHVTGQ